MNARQPNGEFGELSDPTIDLDRTAMLLGHNVVADRQAETGSLAGRLRGEERLNSLSLISAGIPTPLSRMLI